MQLITSAIVLQYCTEVFPQIWHSLCLWGSGQCLGNGRQVCATVLHPTLCRLGLHITWHELLFRWILFQWVYLAFVFKLLIKTVNTPILRPVQTHFFPTKLPWLNISEWLADVQSLLILPKPLNNLSDLIFKMFTVSADSCTVQQQHQGECTYSMLCPKRCEVQWEADRPPREPCCLFPGWAWCYRPKWNLAGSYMQVINIQRECLDRTGTDLQEKTQTYSWVNVGRGHCCSMPKWASLCFPHPEDTQIRQPPKHRIHFPWGKEEDLKDSGTALGHPSVFEMVRVGKIPRWKAAWN